MTLFFLRACGSFRENVGARLVRLLVNQSHQDFYLTLIEVLAFYLICLGGRVQPAAPIQSPVSVA